MERESIDFVDKTLAKYNEELLSVAGLLCRIVYENEMHKIKRIYDENIDGIESDEEDRKLLEKRAAHALTHFTFKQSTPNPLVGKKIESQLFYCLKQELSILSTGGVLPISSVRIPNLKMAGFIKKVPVVPNIILKQCDAFFKKATELMKIKELSLQDVLDELENRILCEDEMIEFLKWWISYYTPNEIKTKKKKRVIFQNNSIVQNSINPEKVEQLKKFARIRIDDQIRALNTFCYYLNPGIIPPDVDLPVEVLPYSISRKLKGDLEKYFGWSALSLIDWAGFIVKDPNLEVDPGFAEKVHQILERNLKNTSKSNKEIVRQLFFRKKCIPTKFGMKFPNQTYFQNINLFPNLPTIQFSKPNSVQNIMELLGVRKVSKYIYFIDN